MSLLLGEGGHPTSLHHKMGGGNIERWNTKTLGSLGHYYSASQDQIQNITVLIFSDRNPQLEFHLMFLQLEIYFHQITLCLFGPGFSNYEKSSNYCLFFLAACGGDKT